MKELLRLVVRRVIFANQTSHATRRVFFELSRVDDVSANVFPAMARLRYKRKNDSTGEAETKFHHNVYVILLDAKAARHRSILRTNPKRDLAKPCVYVGMSGLPPEHRFENHKHGYKAAWVVEKYGVRLMPELYAHLNPMPYDAALQMEMELAEDLRNEGYTVTGGH